MAKNSNLYKFDIIEKIVGEINFSTKEEVVDFAQKMKDVALANDKYDKVVKKAFEDAYKEIKDELTLENLKEIKKIINNY